MYREYLETLNLKQIKTLIRLYNLHTKIVVTKKVRSELIEELIKHTDLKENKIVLKKGLVVKTDKINELKTTPKPRAPRAPRAPRQPKAPEAPEPEEVEEPQEESHSLEQIQGFLSTLSKEQIKRLSTKQVRSEEDKLIKEEANRLLLKGSKEEEEPVSKGLKIPDLTIEEIPIIGVNDKIPYTVEELKEKEKEALKKEKELNEFLDKLDKKISINNKKIKNETNETIIKQLENKNIQINKVIKKVEKVSAKISLSIIPRIQKLIDTYKQRDLINKLYNTEQAKKATKEEQQRLKQKKTITKKDNNNLLSNKYFIGLIERIKLNIGQLNNTKYGVDNDIDEVERRKKELKKQEPHYKIYMKSYETDIKILNDKIKIIDDNIDDFNKLIELLNNDKYDELNKKYDDSKKNIIKYDEIKSKLEQDKIDIYKLYEEAKNNAYNATSGKEKFKFDSIVTMYYTKLDEMALLKINNGFIRSHYDKLLTYIGEYKQIKKKLITSQPKQPQARSERKKKQIISETDKYFIFDTQGKYKKKIINLSYNDDQFIYKDVLVTNSPKTMEEESGSGWRLEYAYSLQSRHNLPFTNPIEDKNYEYLMNDVDFYKDLKEDDKEDGNRHIIVSITDFIKGKKYHVGHIETKLDEDDNYEIEIDIDFVDVFPTYQGMGYSSYLFGLLFSYLEEQDILNKTKLIKLYYAASEKGAIKVYDRAMTEAGFINKELKNIKWSEVTPTELGRLHDKARNTGEMSWYNSNFIGNGRKIGTARNNIKSKNRLAMEEENRRYFKSLDYK